MREKYKRAMTASVHRVLVFPGRTIASSSGISQKAAFRSVPEPVRRNARQSRMLHALILKDTGASAKTSPKIIPDETVRLRWFVEERYLPMRRELGAPAYRKINTFEIKTLPCGALRPDSAEPVGNVSYSRSGSPSSQPSPPSPFVTATSAFGPSCGWRKS
jgi:hypothetical protein